MWHIVVSRSHEYTRECLKAAGYQYQIKLVLPVLQ